MTNSVPDAIQVVRASTHNLKNISVELPLYRWTAITGISGAGKSSLIFDTIHAESQRRYFETLTTSTRSLLEQLERPAVERIEHLPVSIAFQQSASSQSNSWAMNSAGIDELLIRCTLGTGVIDCPECHSRVKPYQPEEVLNLLATLPDGIRFQLAFPVTVTSRTEKGLEQAVAEEQQFWETEGFHRFLELPASDNDLRRFLVIIDRLKTDSDEIRILESLEQAYQSGQGRCWVLMEQLDDNPLAIVSHCRVVTDDQQKPWHGFSFTSQYECSRCARQFSEPDVQLFRRTHVSSACPECAGEMVLKKDVRELCPVCGGLGLNETARHLCPFPANSGSIRTKTFQDLLNGTFADLKQTIEEWHQDVPPQLKPLVQQLSSRLTRIEDLKLSQLKLSRLQRTLSPGELSRLQALSAVSSQLSHTLFLFEEPTSGLSIQDRLPVLRLLRECVSQGNTVVTITHHDDVISSADHVIELGPDAGQTGGEITYSGPASSYKLAFSTEQKETVPATATGQLDLNGVTCHTLQNFNLSVPLKQLIVITGCTGSGKTSLICKTLFPELARKLGGEDQQVIVEVDPFDPPGRITSLTGWESIDACTLMDDAQQSQSIRSTPATYLKAFDEIRKLFAETTDAQARGYKPARFSFNSAQGGRCEHCKGLGTVQLDMQFLADISVTCPECHGKRYTPETLDVTYRNQTIHDVLQMSIDDAFTFFRNHQLILRRLQPLRDAGIGYLSLGQSTTTMSRGEKQRLKLAAHLNATSGEHHLYLFDEPTSGLHPRDVQTLINCFHRLVEQGHTLIVIEHDPAVIQAADHLIEIGLESNLCTAILKQS